MNDSTAGNNDSHQGGLVQSNSVTAQFNALTTDREKFRDAKENALSNCKKVQESLQHLKKEQAALLIHIRTEQEALGTLTRTREMLCNEKVRLTRSIENERKALDVCVKHSRTLDEEADKATLQYVNDMNEASDEAARSMREEIHAGVVALLSVETVQSVIVPQLPSDPKTRQAFYGAFENMQNAEAALEKEASRSRVLRSKCNESSGGGPNGSASLQPYNDQQHQIDLFYGGSDDAEVDMDLV